MTEEEIRNHIFLTLARLYKDPLHRRQYKRFIFEPSEQKLARKILTDLARNYVIEQVQPEVVRLTDLGYQLIQPDLKKADKEQGHQKKPSSGKDLSPPPPEEVEAVSRKLGHPDYISASNFSEGQSEIYWATEGFQEVTGYSIEELKKAGGSIALIRGAENQRKVEQIARKLLDSDEITDELDIVTKNGDKRTIRFVSRVRYDTNGQLAGTISAVKDVT